MRLLLEEPVRMLEETHGLDSLAARSAWLTKLEWGFTQEKDVCVDFDITLASTVYEATLVYPVLFPHAPAWVRPRDRSESWSGHQYVGSGALCLEYGPDNWTPGLTGADLISSTFKLLSYEKLGPALQVETPSRHDLTIGQRVRLSLQRFVVTPQLRASLLTVFDNTVTPITVSTSPRLSGLVSFITKLGPERFPGRSSPSDGTHRFICWRHFHPDRIRGALRGLDGAKSACDQSSSNTRVSERKQPVALE